MFGNTPVYRQGGNLVFGLRIDQIPPDSTDTVIELTQAMGDKVLRLLANDIYGTTGLWWAIADLNGIVDPMTEVAPGSKLRIASAARLASVLAGT